MRCPVCRAENGPDATCRRCKADLCLPVALERQRERIIAQARQAIARGDGAEAVRLATAARGLRGGEDAARLLAAGSILQGRFAEAFALHRAIRAADRSA